MIEAGQRLRFAAEPRARALVGDAAVGQDLDRDLAIEAQVPGEIHDTHAP